MEIKNRKTTRLDTFDYNSVGAYFITICTQNKQCLLSEVKLTSVGTGVLDGPPANKEISVELTEYGRIADKYINQLNDFYKNISVDYYIIMSNHIHLLLNVGESGPSGTPVPTELLCFENATQNSVISRFISTFKRFCNKEYGKNIWQSRSYDHVIRDMKDYETHIKYIYENPLKWFFYGEDHDNVTLYEL